MIYLVVILVLSLLFPPNVNFLIRILSIDKLYDDLLADIGIRGIKQLKTRGKQSLKCSKQKYDG